MPSVSGDTVVGRGETVTSTFRAFTFPTTGLPTPPTLTNYGSITLTSGSTTSVYVADFLTGAWGLYQPEYLSAPAAGIIRNEDTGLISITQTSGSTFSTAMGIYGDFEVYNNGGIHILSNFLAWGVVTDEVFVNRGDLFVAGGIRGVGVGGSGNLQNSGVIEVLGGAIAVGVSRSEGVISNSGIISAHTINGYPSIGVQLGGHLLNGHAPNMLINSGLIDADVAVQSPGVAFVGAGVYRYFAKDIVINTGEMRGDVSLGGSNDQIVNDGLISGSVDLGAHDDVYTGSGQVTGFIDGDEGNDRIIAGAYDDWLSGGEGDDLINGGGGDDLIDGGRGADVLEGGKGFDIATYEYSTAAVFADLSTGIIDSDLRDRVSGIEGLIGSIFNDQLIGSADDNLLEGGKGADILSGGGGADILIGDSGADTLTGGAGADTFMFSKNDGADTITDFNAAAGDRLTIHGYAAAVSTQQVGTNVVLTLSSGDRITLANTVLANLPAGAITFNVAPLGEEPQGTPLRSYMHTSTNVVFSATETLEFSGPAGVVIDPLTGPSQSFFNSGHITLYGGEYGLEAGVPVAAVLVYADTGAPDRSSIVNLADGVIRAVGTHGIAGIANSGGWMPQSIHNYGRIEVESPFSATGINTSSITQLVVNAGVISARGMNAAGLNIALSQQVWNSGQITATGVAGTGAYVRESSTAQGVGLGPYAELFVNTGTITATAKDVAYGVAFGSNRGAEIFNTGRIEAKTAIIQTDGTMWTTNKVYNTGEITGAVQLHWGNDIVFNQGTIIGDVSLNLGDDTYDGRGGVLNGKVSGQEGNDTLYGGAGSDRLDGGDGADRLFGGGGGDTLTGGGGDDRFIVGIGMGEDVITDFVAGGADDALQVEGYTAYLRLEQVGADTRVVFSATDSVLLKNVTATDLTAADFVYVTSTTSTTATVLPTPPAAPGQPVAPTRPAPTFEGLGSERSDTLTGGDGADYLYSLAGNDLINGGRGADVLFGGAGADAFVINSGDAIDVIEDFNPLEGDRIYFSQGSAAEAFSITYETYRGFVTGYFVQNGSARVFLALEGFQQSELLSAVVFGTIDQPMGRLTLLGDASANVLTGSMQAELLDGRDGDDVLSGGMGDDQLIGGLGNDILDGGFDADRMEGGAGDDRYVVDAIGDLVIETAGNGRDTVEAWVDYQIGANVEALTLRGVFALAGTGNALDNEIRGNAAANRLVGLAGDDLIDGGAGNDIIDGGEGLDTVVVRGDRADARLLIVDGGFLLKSADGGDRLVGVELIKFGDGKAIDLRIQYGPDGWGAFVDGFGDAPLVRPAEPVTGAKAGDQPQVLPADDHLPLLDGPQVLPGLFDKGVGDDPLTLPGADTPGGRFAFAADDAGLVVMGPHGPVLLDVDLLHSGGSHDPWA